MRKIVYALAMLAVVATAAGSAVAQIAPEGGEAKGYNAHIHPDGKLHCYDTGTKCISWG